MGPCGGNSTHSAPILVDDGAWLKIILVFFSALDVCKHYFNGENAYKVVATGYATMIDRVIDSDSQLKTLMKTFFPRLIEFTFT